MVEPPRLKKLKTCLLGRSPLRAFYYPKGVRGKWNTADRIMRGTRWNAYLCYGLRIPKPGQNEISRAPPVDGLLKDLKARSERMETQVALRSGNEETRSLAPAIADILFLSASAGTWHCDVQMPASQPIHEAPAPFMDFNEMPRAHAVRDNTPQPDVAFQPTASIQLMFINGDQQIGSCAPPAQITDVPISDVQTPRIPDQVPSVGISHETVQAPTHTVGKTPRQQRAQETTDLMQAPPDPFIPARIRKGNESVVERNPIQAGELQLFMMDAPRIDQTGYEALAPPNGIDATAPQSMLMPVHEMRPKEESGAERHIGYIPSVRKRVKQLKVAQGSDALPPQ